VAATPGLSAVTINAHSIEVASCTFDEERRVIDVAQAEIGERLPIINGEWADGSIEAARIAREWHVRTLQGLPRPVNALTTHSA
jgi:4-hydroxy-tetrahydrodipicolinate synthase